MQLNPRFGDNPTLRLACVPDAALEVTTRQHRRLAEVVSGFDDDQWLHQSRCDAWTNREVISHLDGTNRFWEYSIRMGLAGAPSEVLAAFDPIDTPAQLVAADADKSNAEVLDGFATSTASLCELLDSLDVRSWSTLAEAPPGHQSIGALAHHAHWDAWIHERDILLPMGVTPDEHHDEAVVALRYVLALAPALATNLGNASPGTLGVELSDGPERFRVEVTDGVLVTDDAADNAEVVLRGTAVQLVEELSMRAPLTQPLAADAQWFAGSLLAVQ